MLKITPLPALHGRRAGAPNICLGFLFNRGIAYISDSNLIPESTLEILDRKSSALLLESMTQVAKGAKPAVFVTETLRLQTHPSHFGFAQAVQTARRVDAKMTFFTQIADTFSHSQWTTICKAVQDGQTAKHPKALRFEGGNAAHFQGDAFGAALMTSGMTKDQLLFSSIEKVKGVQSDEDLVELALREIEEWEGGPKKSIWIRPAFDGLAIKVDAEGGVQQSTVEVFEKR